MGIQNAFETLGLLLGTLGGGSVVVFALSGWLGKIWAERLMKNVTLQHEKELARIKDKYQSELEKLKVKLKKSEFLFEHEFRAASELVQFHEEIIPLSQYPDMHMDDVYTDIAQRFGELEKWIKDFVSRNGAILPEKVATELMMGARSSAEHKFSISGSNEEITDEQFDAGEYVYHCIRNARDSMRERVWEQANI